MRSVSGSLTITLLAAVSVGVCQAADISDADLRFFENRIRPILVEHCYECHSEEAGKSKGGLWLDRRAGWLTGGDSGPAAKPHDVEGSLLIETVRYADPDLEMPPDGKLSPSDILALEEWVKKGLPDPRGEVLESGDGGFDLEERKQYWSYQARKTEFGERRSIDDFINAGLSSQGLEALPATTPESLLRRAKIDLTGLIPTPGEIESFAGNPDRGNYEAFVDGWLETHAFGERWGRHWLDIVRYADSSGGGRAAPFPNAWRLRDYVIDSFADDRPLDDLIKAHIAGDLLPSANTEERVENLIATGFLVMGPINYENQNKDELEFEIIDEQIDTLGRAFMGQTIGCARCHDHKFDPIPTSDYYAMAGIFKSTDFVTHANVSKWHTEPIPPTEEAKKAIEEHAKSKGLLQGRIAEIKSELASLGHGAGSRVASVAVSSLRGIVVDNTDAIVEGEWKPSTSEPRWVGDGYLHDLNERSVRKSARFDFEIPGPGLFEIRMSYSSSTNRSTAVPVTVEGGGISETVIVNQRLKPEHDRLFHTLGKWTFTKGGKVSVTVRNSPGGDGHVMADAVQCLSGENSTPLAGDGLVAKSRVRQLEADLNQAEASLKALIKSAPRIPTAMSVVDRAAEERGDTEIRIRGVEANRGPIVPRGFLQAAKWDGMDEEAYAISQEQSGRLELANWVTARENPLTARVLANRIWLHLMGEGLVRTPDNFGITGQKPTHPDLLDFLAGRLIDSGWSTKALVREIMMSDVYARCSRAGEGAQAKADPENKLYWRAHLRPLNAEALRDAMLTLSGELDLKGGGPSLPKNFRSEFGHQFVTLKRSVYVPAFRNSGYEMFSVFDFANPNFTVGKRADSTIPTQALFLTNSPFVHERAGKAAARLAPTEAVDLDDGIRRVFLNTLARNPTGEELALTRQFIEEHPEWEADPVAAWAALQPFRLDRFSLPEISFSARPANHDESSPFTTLPAQVHRLRLRRARALFFCGTGSGSGSPGEAGHLSLYAGRAESGRYLRLQTGA
ncbi:MAG: DUF1553 domain-containing protein, partial [Verrucomicrobiales bacterium]|nr:DUF1553 domain-containing protein [Verrucomicrobiales bacterium]